MKRKLAIFLAFIMVIVNMPIAIKVKAATTTNNSNNLYVKSTFIQSWYCKDWTLERWESEMDMLKNIGVEELIIQETADTKNKITMYKTSMEGYSSNSTDMVENLLTAADKYNMNVRIGLGFSSDWWVYNANNEEWLKEEMNTNINIFNEINTKYGEHKSLSSWYIPYEFSQFSVSSQDTHYYLNSFLRGICNEIKSKTNNETVMISPFYNTNLSPNYLSQWKDILYTIFKDSNIDIVAFQDGYGVHGNTLEDIKNLLTTFREVLDSLNIKLYANIETFDSQSSGEFSAIPTDINRIKSQIETEAPYVDGIIAFSLCHYQSKNIEGQKSSYDMYERYYLFQVEENCREDLNGDGIVDIIDIVLLAKTMDSKVGDANYNEAYNISLEEDSENKIDLLDLEKVASKYKYRYR